jgi:hypothetical protein
MEDVAMLVESIAKSPQPAWQEQAGRQFDPAGAPAPISSFDQPDDDLDPDPPPAASAMRAWPRVFPGL